MQIGQDTVVAFHFTLTDSATGAELESSAGDAPRLYLHGHHALLPGLEAALAGRVAGDRVEVTLTATEAYGERRDDAIERVPLKHLQTAGKRIRQGDVAGLRTADGHTIPVTVVKLGKFAVDVDRNHPYAGKALRFAIDVASVRAASRDEIAHGHAHGPGGHHH
jgi:FKBP-type peptidyl-prolyl cis-trans isomerase SlyD